MKNLLKMSDLSNEDIVEILDLAEQLKYELKNGIEHFHLKGKTLGLIFEKASTRTRVSFEVGMVQLGGYPLFLSGKDMQINRGEPIEDTARVLSRYLDGIMIRTYEQKTVEDLAKFSTIPIINGLTDYAHPCQVLADLMTIREKKTRLDGLKVCFVSDGNNIMNSLIVGTLRTGMKISVACPGGYEPAKEVLEITKEYGDNFQMYRKPEDAARGADVVITDVWKSMGQENDKKNRMKDFQGYQVNDKLMSLTNEGCMVQHCLPVHRGEEITAECFENHADEIFEEAENRLHVQKAILVKLLGKK